MNDLIKFINQFKSARANGTCPICEKKVDRELDFTDPLSRKEFDISGMCQDCQDKFFDED